jgi:hypothetical protein
MLGYPEDETSKKVKQISIDLVSCSSNDAKTAYTSQQDGELSSRSYYSKLDSERGNIVPVET